MGVCGFEGCAVRVSVGWDGLVGRRCVGGGVEVGWVMVAWVCVEGKSGYGL